MLSTENHEWFKVVGIKISFEHVDFWAKGLLFRTHHLWNCTTELILLKSPLILYYYFRSHYTYLYLKRRLLNPRHCNFANKSKPGAWYPFSFFSSSKDLFQLLFFRQNSWPQLVICFHTSHKKEYKTLFILMFQNSELVTKIWISWKSSFLV